MEFLPIEVADEVLLVVPIDRNHENPFLLAFHGAIVNLQLKEVWTFETAVGASGRAEVAEPCPLLQVGRGVEGNFAL